MANKATIFERLVGLETEYAMRFHSNTPQQNRPAKYQLYRALTLALRRRILTVPARHLKDGVFTAAGGAVWFEVERPIADAGLIEGSTPECRGPRQLLAYQRAQDRLLADAAQAAGQDDEFTLLKNDRDALGNVYGAHENYEATLATGWRLAAWRVGLIALLPLVAVTWLCFLLLIVGTLIYMAVAAAVYLPLQALDREHKRISLLLFGRDLTEGTESGQPCPLWLATLLDRVTRVFTAPLALGLWLLCRWFAFAQTRRDLTPFLLSRALIGGAGHVDHSGRFHLADKAPAMNCVVGFGGFLCDRPIFTYGHFFKSIFFEACLAPREYFHWLRPRQRLQIALGDSNMADTAEYLRIGTTLLVLDCSEAGELGPVPCVKRPIAALRRICADPSLQATVLLAGGGAATALELQRYYFEACRRFLDRRPDAPPEARDVLRRWGETLDRLEHDPLALVGEIDWVTKKFLLDQTGCDASYPARKKIDLRYHELSDAGYFMKLRNDEQSTVLADEDAIARAMRAPPSDSPATTRGHYIREFAGGEEPVAANWKYVFLGEGSKARAIRIADYGRSGAPAPKSKRTKRRGSDLST